MGNFLNIALTFPPVIFSFLLVVVVIYWLSVMVGVLDLDLFDLDFDLDVDMDVDLDVDMDMGGAAESAADGAAESAAEGAAEGSAEHGDTPGLNGILLGIYSWLSLGRVPITITVSVFTLYAWIMTFSGVYYLGASLPVAIGLFVGATAASLFLTGPTVRPMRGLFHTHTKHGQETLIGALCVLTTGRVDEKFGQALFDDGGAGLNLLVRCDSPENGIKRGDRALIIGYDSETRLYYVEPYENLAGQETKFDFETRLEDAGSMSDVTLNGDANIGEKNE